MCALRVYVEVTRRRFFVALLIALLILVLSFMAQLAFGAVTLNPLHVLEDGLREILTATTGVARYRLERALAGVVVGASLALSGYLIQTTTRNPLGDPYLLGISSGALFAVVLTFALPASAITLFVVRPFAALIGGIIAYLLTLLIASKAGMTPTSIVLSGVAVGTFFYSASLFPQYFILRDIHKVFAWSMGSLVVVNLNKPIAIALALAVCTIYSCVSRNVLNALSISDDFVRDLGRDPSRERVILTAMAAVLASFCVAYFGVIGFVGLASPHFARRLLGSGDARYIIPLSLVFGASLLSLTDVAAKTVFYPIEVPVNVVVSLVGAPTLAAIMVGMRRHAQG